MTIGERIKRARSVHGWTQTHLAQVALTTRRSISRWENGDFHPSPMAVSALATAMGCRREWLAKGEGSIL